jgi:hypothetical protein
MSTSSRSTPTLTPVTSGKMAVHVTYALDPGLTVHPFVAFTHRSTDCAQCCLTSVIEGTDAFNIAYGR